MPQIDELLKAKSHAFALGGKSANALVSSARLGSKNAFISKVNTPDQTPVIKAFRILFKALSLSLSVCLQ